MNTSVKEQLYAMKIIRKNEIKEKHLIQNEKKLLENLDNPFIVKLKYAFQSMSKLYLVMDFMQGGSIFNLFEVFYKIKML